MLVLNCFISLMTPYPPGSTLFPYTTLFRSILHGPFFHFGDARGHGDDYPRRNQFPMMNFLRSEEHTSELQSRGHLVCRLLLEKKKHTEAIAEFMVISQVDGATRQASRAAA